jgi:exopolyphosphatase/guanosine-5'-triphosphate,3'-diphosphate pyrophosphatase
VEEVRPRWEWRTFGSSFGVAEERFGALESTGVQESDELYLLSQSSNANLKVRFDLLDVKVLVDTDSAGLQQWRPVIKDTFPLSDSALRNVFKAAGLPSPSLARDTYTLDEFLSDVAPGVLRPVTVHKRRVRYKVNGCTSEVTDVSVDGTAVRTIAIESEDGDAVVAAVAAMGLADYLNTDYGKGLAAVLDGTTDRFAVIDVGTNSVKFHVGERVPGAAGAAGPGGWRRVVDRAEVTRLGEGVDDGGAISEAALDRTADAISAMADEAKANGARAIAIVGTAVFRIASNADQAIARIRERSGLNLQVVSGEEESRLAYLATSSSIPSVSGTTVVFDTGGGSSQFTFGRRGQVSDRFSVNVGAAWVTERFGLDGPVSAEVIDQARAAISAALSDLDGKPRPEAVVGMGGAVTNMTAVAKSLAEYDPDQVQGAVLTAGEIERQIELYRTLSADERREIVGLQPKRAEVILAGACNVRAILEKLGAESFTVSDRGLRHGVLMERFG